MPLFGQEAPVHCMSQRLKLHIRLLNMEERCIFLSFFLGVTNLQGKRTDYSSIATKVVGGNSESEIGVRFECTFSLNLTHSSLLPTPPSALIYSQSVSQSCSALMSPRLYHPRRKPFQIRVDDDEHNCDKGREIEQRKSGNFEAVWRQT